MSQPPNPPYSGPPYPEQPPSGPPYQGYQPSSGQPYPGQQPPAGQSYPNPDVPGAVPPGYPSYGQPPPPDHAQTGYPQSAPPGGGYPGAPEPKKKSKAVPIVLVSLAVVLVLCLGGGLAIFLAARNKANDIVDAAREAASAAPTTPATTDPLDPLPTTEPTPTQEARPNITIAAPKTLGGRSKLTDPQFASLAKELESGLGDVPGATNSVGAIYGSVPKRNIVIIAGAEAPIDDPARELNGTFVGAGIGGLKVTGIQTVDAGELGGSAKCGKSDEQGIDMVLCGWADEGSVGWVIYFFKSVSSAKAEFPKLRAQIEKKS